MEVIRSNIQHPLNRTAADRRSLIKPPVPPKPKIIPKPKSSANLRKVNSKLLRISYPGIKCTEIGSGECGLHWDCLPSTERQANCENQSSPDTPETLVSNPDYAKNKNNDEGSRIPIHPIQVSHDEDDSSTSPGLKITLTVGEGDACDDTQSHLMEKTLENCIELNSKSSSDSSSLSLGESDSDEFSSIKDDTSCFDPSHNITFGNTNENNATEIINNTNSSNSSIDYIRKPKDFLVAKEIATSESSFVATLKLLNEDFKRFLYDRGCVNPSTEAGSSSVPCRSDAITKEQLDEILKYLPNLQNLNEAISADLELRISEWETHRKIADIIVKKGPFLKLYANYIMELEYHTNLLLKCAERYSFFGECLKEFETSELSRFIPVSKHMLTPMQRITKYKELMKQYLKYLPEDSIDYADAVQALDIVKDVAEHANEAIRELENSARLLCLQERLNGISNTDSTLIGIATGNPQHLLVEPGRRLLKEGQLMKLCRRGVRMVYLILLSDCLLYTTQELHGGKNCPLKLRYKLPLEGMRVKIPKSEDFQNEFTVISTFRSFTIRASSAKERDTWLASLRNAIESNARRRISFEKARTAEFDFLDSNTLGTQAPAWVPDNRVTMCQLCTSEFTLTFRRHHCRACGKVVCRHCSANRAPLAYMDNNTERVCDICFDELQKALQGMEQKEEEIDDERERERVRKYIITAKGRFSQRGIRDNRTRKLKKPERLREVCGGDHSSQICGYLRHFSRKTWRQSWFVLKDKVLYEYGAPEDVCALSSLPILGYSVNTEFKSLDIFDGMASSNAFQLLHSNQLPLIFYAESNDLAYKWRTVMEREVDL